MLSLCTPCYTMLSPFHYPITISLSLYGITASIHSLSTMCCDCLTKLSSFHSGTPRQTSTPRQDGIPRHASSSSRLSPVDQRLSLATTFESPINRSLSIDRSLQSIASGLTAAVSSRPLALPAYRSSGKKRASMREKRVSN